MCTGRIARVRGVMDASIASGSMLNVSSSISANTGVACWKRITLAEEMKENDEVITSSPGPTPSRASAACRPAEPPGHGHAQRDPGAAANAPYKPPLTGPEGNKPGPD